MGGMGMKGGRYAGTANMVLAMPKIKIPQEDEERA